MNQTKYPATTLRAINGLYAITPDLLDLSLVRQALANGTKILQYRNKQAHADVARIQAQQLRELTREYGVTFIVNDNARLAQQVDADGVHLGGDDGSISDARALLGVEKIIGVSCYNRLDLARLAVAQGADYVAFGSFFASSVKPHAPVATLDLLRSARAELAVPIVTIGGITLDNAAVLLDAGADAVAVISALFSTPDVANTARQFSQLFSQKETHDFA